MTKRLFTLTLFVSLFAASALALDGAWTASLDSDRDHLHLNIAIDHDNMSMSITLASLASLTPSQVSAATMTPVTFALHREAGTIAFEGTFRNGKGAGELTFTADRSYIEKLRPLGVAFELAKHRLDEENDLFILALHDVSTAYIKSMQDLGYKTTLEKYLAMRIFNITPEYVHEMEAASTG